VVLIAVMLVSLDERMVCSLADGVKEGIKPEQLVEKSNGIYRNLHFPIGTRKTI
jgi:hypothetical protein